jgi:hypothetical protein
MSVRDKEKVGGLKKSLIFPESLLGKLKPKKNGKKTPKFHPSPHFGM